MSKTRIALAALAATCVMGLAASSASAAITVGPGAGPWPITVTLPKATGGFDFNVGGTTWPCGATMSGVLTSTGAVSLSSVTEDPTCAGTFAFHTPFAGQIVGSPGNYSATIPMSFTYTYNGLWTCEHSGTVQLRVNSGSTVVGPVSGVATAPSTPTCSGSVRTMMFLGTGGTISPARSITGTL